SLSMLSPYRRQMVAATVLVTLWTFTVLAGPFLVKYAIDYGIVRKSSTALDRAVVVYIGVAIAAYFIYRAQIVLIGLIGEGFLRDLRLRVFTHLQALSMPFYDREKAGVIVSRMTSDIDSLAELIQMGLLQFASQGLLLMASIGFLLALSWRLSLLVLAVMPLVVLSSIRF